ncbi:MAG: tRNA preQ1(34) S-adenosylmethionine ribosyltransferase-isomerase QueA [Candidatus Sericytochromatia bacterium]|uniref:S-adenosylmethionine:tRNA ribosyltransferase-isomerase n=1 Tax=Candidatus Tanganyikabacteria bacterium TaxID=2961651 RepID=A0A937X607_9BACT|nr:tRNA preQ1(34) S-adenosylmethionine ribosyltransferase-isomerase QueA [Candidatus Tanganyikabacteria bacterium]
MTRLSDLDFDLPAELIAQEPAPQRDQSRLLALLGPETRHCGFRDVLSLLHDGDLLVLNDTKVLPARLFGTLSGGGRAEALLVEELSAGRWTAMVKPGRKLKRGATISFGSHQANVEGYLPGGERILQFSTDPYALMAEAGELPLPPYIQGKPADPDRYQTVFAARPGAVAAPTAGLHFTPELLGRLADRGIRTATLTLHVGPGTFRPIQVDDPAEHTMHAERFIVPPEAAGAIARTRLAGGRVVAVGTTVTRTLEAVSDPAGIVPAGEGATDLFIRPGYRFKVVDGLITNFHLPRSTLLMLVAAFADHAGLGGLARVQAAYREAVALRYRFFSFGDAMIMLPES